MTRDEIVSSARSMLGTPWVHEGRSRGGVDCVGLLCVVGSSFGIQFEDKRGYDRNPSDMTFLRHLMSYLPRSKDAKVMAPGSVAVIRQSRYACHVGIFARQPRSDYVTLIHSLPDMGVIEHLFQPRPDFGLVATLDFPGAETWPK